MIVKGTLQVDVDPKDVIRSLLDIELGGGDLITEPSEVSDDLTRYYILHHVSHGPHTVEEKKSITLDKYKYIYNLIQVLQYLGIPPTPPKPTRGTVMCKERSGGIFKWF
jgi:hypothetical protein